MRARSFKIFGTKTDLENIFKDFQTNNTIKYYKCGKNPNTEITNITTLDNFGISLNGNHIGNQYLIIQSNEIIQVDSHNHISQDLNQTSIVIDLGGLYYEDKNIILPTTISTIWYDNENSRNIYNHLKRISKKYSSTTINGYMILQNAYAQKDQSRFKTISVHSPAEYDLIV